MFISDRCYRSLFVAGMINDVIIGIPIGISIFCYLLIFFATAYIRNITLSPNFINDWLSFLFIILLVNSIQVIILDLIFFIEVDYLKYLIKLKYPKKILYFHNDPLEMSGSKKIDDRIYLLDNLAKIIFNRNWSKSRFIENLPENYITTSKLKIIKQ